MSQTQVTASVVNGSSVVTVTGSDLSAIVKKNAIFMVGGDYVPYFVAANSTYSSVTNVSTINLTGAYAGATGDVAAVFATDFTTPDSIPTIAPGDVGTATIFTQAMYRIQALISTLTGTGVDGVGDSVLSAEQAATAAATSATVAQQSASNANTSAINAASSASAAQAAAASTQNSQAQADAAAASATLAQKWASNPVNTVVANGEYSAYHWAQQARASLTGQLIYRGLFDASAGTLPATPTAGDYYIVTTAGTISGVSYNPGDALVYGDGAWHRQGAGTDLLQNLLHMSSDGLRLGINAAADPSAMVYMKSDVPAGQNLIALELHNIADSGYCQMAFRKNDGTRGLQIGWGNTNVGLASLRNTAFIWTQNGDPIIVAPHGVEAARFFDGGNISFGSATPRAYGTRRVLSLVGKTNVEGPTFSLETLDGSTALGLFCDNGITQLGGLTANSQLNLLAGNVVQQSIYANGWTKFTKGKFGGSEVANTFGSGAATINWENGANQSLVLTGNPTLTFVAPSRDGVYLLNLRVVQDNIGNRSVIWPGYIQWEYGFAPALNTGANKSNLFSFYVAVVGGVASWFCPHL